MAKIFDKFKEIIGGDFDDDEYDNEYDNEYGDYEKELPHSRSLRNDDYEDYVPEKKQSKKSANSQVVSIHTNLQMQVIIIKPEKYEDAQDICDQVKSRKPVVVNLEKVEFPIAQRIMDFLSGTCYSLDGTLQRVANNIFIIAPENVDISGDFKEELKTKGIILPWINQGK